MVEPGANGTLGVDQLDAAEWWWWPPASLRGWQVWSHWLSAVAGSGANALVAGVIVGHGDLHSARVMYWLCVAVANQLGHVRALLEVLCPPPTPARRLVAQLAGLPTCLLLIVMLIGSVDRLIFTKCEEWHSRRVTARHMLAAQGLSAVLFLVQDGGRFWTLGATAAAKEIVYRERGLFIVLVSTCLIAVKIVLYWHGRWRVAGVVDEISVGSVAAAPEEAQADVESSLRVHRTSARVGDDERRSTLIFLYGLLPLSVCLASPVVEMRNKGHLHV